MADIKKLANLLVDAVNKADDLAVAATLEVHVVELTSIRDQLDFVLRRVQRMVEHERGEERF
jgi:hypothetical protein